MDCKVAVVQHKVGFQKEDNLKRAKRGIKEGKNRGADIVLLPEMFNCPYSNKYFPKFAESYSEGMTCKFLSEQARENEIYLIGGSIPEREGDRLYNTCFVFGPDGKLLGRHRKMHLFDIDVEGGIRFKESDTLTAGDEITVVDTEFGKVGVGICYDIRFPELFRMMSLRGARLIAVPAAFNMTTGPAHWEILLRTRAVDNQVYVAACSPARDTGGVYTAWGHSMVVDPWGTVVNQAGAGEEVLVAEIKTEKIDKVRREMPLMEHLRKDVYFKKGVDCD